VLTTRILISRRASPEELKITKEREAIIVSGKIKNPGERSNSGEKENRRNMKLH